MQNGLIIIAGFVAFAFLGVYVRRNPVSMAKAFSLGKSDGTGAFGRFVRFCGLWYLAIGSIGAVFFSIRLLIDLVKHGTEF
jgi:hypothetical protein